MFVLRNSDWIDNDNLLVWMRDSGFAKKILKHSKEKLKKIKLIPTNSKEYRKIYSEKKTVERPLNSLLNIRKLEKFLNLKMPNWERIFEKKINKIIEKYK